MADGKTPHSSFILKSSQKSFFYIIGFYHVMLSMVECPTERLLFLLFYCSILLFLLGSVSGPEEGESERSELAGPVHPRELSRLLTRLLAQTQGHTILSYSDEQAEAVRSAAASSVQVLLPDDNLYLL